MNNNNTLYESFDKLRSLLSNFLSRRLSSELHRSMLDVDNFRLPIEQIIQETDQARISKKTLARNTQLLEEYIRISLENLVKIKECIQYARSTYLVDQNSYKPDQFINALHTLHGFLTKKLTSEEHDDLQAEIYDITKEVRSISKTMSNISSLEPDKENLLMHALVDLHGDICSLSTDLDDIKELIDNAKKQRAHND